jgi:dynein heavy chain
MKPREKPIDPDPKVVPRKLPDENKWIWDIIEEVREKLTEGIKPLFEYKKSWDEYLDLLKLDPDEFTRNIEMEENAWEVDQIQGEIAQII